MKTPLPRKWEGVFGLHKRGQSVQKRSVLGCIKQISCSRLRMVCFQMSTIECQEDGSSLVWNGGWTPQGGSSRQMSHYRFWRYSTSRCGPGTWVSTLMLICQWRRMWLELPGPAFTIFVVCARYDAILDETWPRDWYPPLSFQGWIIVTLCWLTCRLQRWLRFKEFSTLLLNWSWTWNQVTTCHRLCTNCNGCQFQSE